MRSGIGRRASWNVSRVRRYGPAGLDVATTAATRGSAAAARIEPMPPIEWPTIAPTLTSGCSIRAWKAASESCPNSPARQWQLLGRVLAVAADVEGQAVEPGGVEEHGEGQRAIARRFPAVDEDDARAALTASRRDEPGRQGDAVGFDEHRFVRQAEIGRRDPGRVPARVPGPHAIGQREAVGEAERGSGSGSRDPGAAEVPHTGRGRQRRLPVKSGRRRRRPVSDRDADRLGC